MPLDVRMVETHEATEVHITAAPSPGTEAEAQAHELFTAVRDTLRRVDARIFAERIFATTEALEAIAPVRSGVYGDLDDGVPPTRLVTPQGAAGPLAGIVVHGVRSPERTSPIHAAGAACGRMLRLGESRFVSLSGIAPSGDGSPSRQAREMFEIAEGALGEVGATMHSVARSWLWLGDILSWYDDFNCTRTQFFTERGLLNGAIDQVQLPASTGIGIQPAAKAICAIDLLAVMNAGRSIVPLQEGGNQGSAYSYGSAFSRALRATMPAGETVFVSGTAAIDANGVTVHRDDPEAQIATTLENVRAILTDTGCTDDDVVQAIAYCKTPEVERMFRAGPADLSWPCLTVIADVCRRNLWFEIEATACPSVRKS